MALKRIEPRVLLPQPYEHRPTSDVVIWRSDDLPGFPLTMSIDLGNARADLHLSIDSARDLRDQLNAALIEAQYPMIVFVADEPVGDDA